MYNYIKSLHVNILLCFMAHANRCFGAVIKETKQNKKEILAA
jgi:hypothetical protein